MTGLTYGSAASDRLLRVHWLREESIRAERDMQLILAARRNGTADETASGEEIAAIKRAGDV